MSTQVDNRTSKDPDFNPGKCNPGNSNLGDARRLTQEVYWLVFKWVMLVFARHRDPKRGQRVQDAD